MNRSPYSRQTAILVVGDLLAYFFSLIITLALRYGQVPNRALLSIHLPSFTVLFIVFLIINYGAGLYNRQALLSDSSRTLGLLIRSQIIDILVSIAFFYLAPVAIAPKANLLIYFIVSMALLVLWRMIMFPVVSMSRNQRAILVGSGQEIDELAQEINTRARYGFIFAETIVPRASAEETTAIISEKMKKSGVSVIVVDMHNPIVQSSMPYLYSLIFAGLQVIDAGRLYEDIFGRIPLSMVGERWLVENTGTSVGGRMIYDAMKRLMDVVVSLVLGIISLIFYPFIWLAIKLEDRGPLFITQNRIGYSGQPIKIMKFRSMTANDSGAYTSGSGTSTIASGKSQLKITRVGRFIRLTRLDELPQLWNVLRGDISIIGPRPELPALVAVYEKEIPYYHVRHLIKPGLSGWAQIYHRAHPHHAVAVGDTRDKLSYDLYYIKHRSFMLDVRIALETLRAMMSKRGI